MRLRAETLDAAKFVKFGAVVSCDRTDVPGKAANLGTAERRDFVCDVANLRPGARLNLATFRCRPWEERPLRLGMLEKHPASSQLFLPMATRTTPVRYLVVVAEGAHEPLVEGARAFVAHGGQGISYAPGTWHHPIIALGDEVDFSCLVWEDGTAGDCVTFDLSEPLLIDGV